MFFVRDFLKFYQVLELQKGLHKILREFLPLNTTYLYNETCVNFLLTFLGG